MSGGGEYQFGNRTCETCDCLHFEREENGKQTRMKMYRLVSRVLLRSYGPHSIKTNSYCTKQRDGSSTTHFGFEDVTETEKSQKGMNDTQMILVLLLLLLFN